MDRSFDASGFVTSHLQGPRAQEILRDCDPKESVRWAEWAMIRVATIMKSVEPHLTIAEEAERRNAKLLGDAKTLNLQKMVLEEEKADAIRAKLKEKGAEIDRLRRREEGFLAGGKVPGFGSRGKKQCEDLAEDAKGAIAATEGALKAQLAILVPDFDTDQISFFKDIVDGRVMEPTD
ncbi:hypothetical protein PIB30_087763 [Stylosanthes scabra]|uniref:Uncharacterized protein n=1 Tax=Stylosanthes scabra TaxID=79078 RepID=A0ABU6WTG0_9FABA|nr:hypothetical protein [Stylosanthes scabra]